MTDQPDLSKLDQRLREVVALKHLPRRGWLRVGVSSPESIAAHSWGVVWLVLALCPPGVDRGRALAIAALHDLAELRTGDITPHDGVSREEKATLEERALRDLLDVFPQADELHQLWREFEESSTPEGQLVRDCDRLDMALQAHVYEAEEAVDTAEFIRSALQDIGDETLRRLASGQQ